jgi:3-oxoadipate enol-lactonase
VQCWDNGEKKLRQTRLAINQRGCDMSFCKIDDIKLYYEDCGVKNQVPLRFLHGVMGSSEIWKPQVSYFKNQRRIIILDLRGHGQSDKPRGKYSVTQFSDDLHSLMKNLDVEKAIIIGHSLGGMIALKVTLDYQDMVDKLILIDTTAKPASSFRRRLLLSLSKSLIDISYRSFLKIYVSRYSDLEDSDLEEVVTRLLKTPKHVTKSCFSAIAGFDVTSELAKILVPTLIIHGEESSTPVVLAEYMNQHIPNAELIIIEGAGHASPKENPDKIWKAIERFI